MGRPSSGGLKSTARLSVKPETRVLLEQIAAIHERSLANTIEYLLKKEAKALGIFNRER